MSSRYVPDRNDIVWLDFEPSKGKEIGKYRLHRARKGSLLPVKMKPAFIL